ncbi:hypothetical protein HQ487_02375 [Candidatus Uhrbacteria bacterium]|nr:hypothetical protein [Candidatus Uhrbacteria bacterium]
MLKRILTVSLFTVILGLVIAQRFFSLPPELVVRIGGGAGEDAGYGFGNSLQRGSIIETGDGFLEVKIGKTADLHASETTIWLSKNTRIELHRLYEDELVIRLKKGRIVVSTQAENPLTIETNYTSSIVYQDTASFINYDFLETIQIIPLTGVVQTTLKSSNESLLTPTPISIHETDPVSVDAIEVNLEAGDSAEFYEWSGVLSDK